MANVANKAAAKADVAVEAVKPVVDRKLFFDAGRIGKALGEVKSARQDASEKSVTNFLDALGNALIHGNASLLNRAVADLTDAEKVGDKKITHSAIARKVLVMMNETIMPSNKIAGGRKADIFAFSKDGISVKSDRMLGRGMMTAYQTEAEIVESFRNRWHDAIIALAEKVKTDKPVYSLDAIPTKLERLVKAIGAEFSQDDDFAMEVYRELSAMVKSISKRASDLKAK